MYNKMFEKGFSTVLPYYYVYSFSAIIHTHQYLCSAHYEEESEIHLISFSSMSIQDEKALLLYGDDYL